MADVTTKGPGLKYKPYVPVETDLKEFTMRALILGLIMTVVLGAANAYLGLKAGMTIAATYPAAVIGMALLRIMKGSILEENFARTVGSIGESVAAGAIFTIPAFYIAKIWHPDNNSTFATVENFLISVAIMFAGGLLGIMFVALLRRVMVEDVELPFPESVAAGEIHKAGQRGGSGAKFLFGAMGIGAFITALGELKLFASSWASFVTFFETIIKGTALTAKGGMVLSSPAVKPAYIGVGYIIGPKLASLNFSGGLLAWGLLTPIIYYFLGPSIDLQAWASQLAAASQIPLEKAAERVQDPIYQMTEIWKFIVRPIAIGGMLVGAGYTLFRMRKSLATGISRSISDVKKAATGEHVTIRTEKDLSFNWVLF
ncbi:MAG: OPT/YSL family transporter, partial [Bacteroidetes bacterium]|nr:OPT/YSL family transporter [Bacteroidota bacterium]